MNGWQLAHISHADLEPILAIERRSFQWPWGRPYFEGKLISHNARNYVVKEAEGQPCEPILAYAFLRMVVDEVHVLKIAVTPARRKQGIASWLMAMLGPERRPGCPVGSPGSSPLQHPGS